MITETQINPFVSIEAQIPEGIYQSLKRHVADNPTASQDDIIAVAIALYLSMNSMQQSFRGVA